MAAFDRSPAGRANRAMFYDVDRVVYVEGGRDDKGVMESFDGLFWRRIFSVMQPALKLRILPRGGKESLVELAELLSADTVDNVIIAMDRDYDGIFERLIDKPAVIYTFGYSYENDAFLSDSLASLFYSICPVCDDSVDVEAIVSALISEYCSDVWWAQFADVCGGIVARKVIDRGHVPKYLISSAHGSRPKISKSAFAIDVYKANTGSPRIHIRSVPYRKSDLPHLSVGHLYAHFCFRLISYLHATYSSTQKLTKDAVLAGAINNFAAYLRLNPDSEHAIYYRSALDEC